MRPALGIKGTFSNEIIGAFAIKMAKDNPILWSDLSFKEKKWYKKKF